MAWWLREAPRCRSSSPTPVSASQRELGGTRFCFASCLRRNRKPGWHFLRWQSQRAICVWTFLDQGPSDKAVSSKSTSWYPAHSSASRESGRSGTGQIWSQNRLWLFVSYMLSTHAPNWIKAAIGVVCKNLSFGTIWLPKSRCCSFYLCFTLKCRHVCTVYTVRYIEQQWRTLSMLIKFEKKNKPNLYFVPIYLPTKENLYCGTWADENPNLFASWTQKNRIFFLKHQIS